MVELDMIDTTGTDFPKGKKEKEVPQLRSNVQQIQYQELPEPKATDNLGIPEATPISAREAIKYQPQQTANKIIQIKKREFVVYQHFFHNKKNVLMPGPSLPALEQNMTP